MSSATSFYGIRSTSSFQARRQGHRLQGIQIHPASNIVNLQVHPNPIIANLQVHPNPIITNPQVHPAPLTIAAAGVHQLDLRLLLRAILLPRRRNGSLTVPRAHIEERSNAEDSRYPAGSSKETV